MDNQDKFKIFTLVKDLEEAWVNKYPKRASGGQIALAGFSYQFRYYLLMIIKKWLELGHSQHSHLENFISATEKISDILDIDKNGYIIATQSKITLKSNSLNDSLDEFLCIWQVAKDIDNLILSKLRFKILTSKSEVSDINVSLRKWVDKRSTILGETTNDFINSIELITESKPENQIMELLVNELKCPDPLGKMRIWLGLLMDLAKTSETLAEVGRYIWNDLNTLWIQKKSDLANLYLWDLNDRAPNSISKGNVLTGQRPSVRHLREGYFYPRTDLYNGLGEQLRNWSDRTVNSNDDKIQIFWIGGRSGSGKSVALLHMLSKLYDSTDAPIVWLGHHTNLLGSAINFALNNQFGESRAIIGLDDPYVVQEGVSQNWEEAFTALHTIRQNEGNKRIPIIIACGPTEQAELLRADYCDELNIYIYELQHETSNEQESLRKWYLERTGQEPPKVNSDNLLMVQIFFQWDRHETIYDFSIRLKERLLQGDPSGEVIKLVSRILAVNRLYVGYPTKGVRQNLSAEQKDLMDWLENDLHLGEKEINGRYGYWLLHAHLANAIYLNWYASKPSSFMEYLKEAIWDSLKFGERPNEQMAPLWSISRIFRKETNTDVSQRLDYHKVVKLLKEIYLDLVKTYDNILPLWMLPFWVEIGSLGSEIQLMPSAINMAILQIKAENIQSKGLRLTCHKLLENINKPDLPLYNQLIDSIIDLLSTNLSWYEWTYVAKDLLLVSSDKRLIQIIINKLYQNLYDEKSINLLLHAMKIWPQNNELIKAANACLESAPCTLCTGDIAKSIINQSQSGVPQTIVSWINKYKTNEYICFVLGEALSMDYNSFEEVALEWAGYYHYALSSNFVLEPLLEKRPEDNQVIGWCYKWLVYGEGEKSYILEKLLLLNPSEPEIIQLALKWLDKVGPNHSTRSYVLNALQNTTNISDSTFDMGIKWLENNEIYDESWPYTWISMHKIKPNNYRVIELGEKWLIEMDNHSSWPYVWQEIKDYSNRLEIYTYAIKWLENNNTSLNSWTYIWKAINEKYPNDEQTITLGILWLRNEPYEHVMWPYIWQSIFKQGNSNEKIFELGFDWLIRSKSIDATWTYIWKALYEKYSSNERIVKLGLLWLKEGRYEDVMWPYIWQILFKQINTNKEFLELGFDWLINSRRADSTWICIWSLIYKIDKEDKRILEIGMNWLTEFNLNTTGWEHIWLSVFKMNDEDERMIKLGKKYLNSDEISIGSWSNVWSFLYKMYPFDQELLKMAYDWIYKTNSNNGAWQSIWLTLNKVDPNNKDIDSLGFDWLLQGDLNSGFWPDIWLSINKISKKNNKLLKRTKQWLSMKKYNHSLWVTVWLEYNNLVNEKTNSELAIEWLGQAESFADVMWYDIYKIVFDFVGATTRMINLGRSYLNSDVGNSEAQSKLFTLLIKMNQGTYK